MTRGRSRRASPSTISSRPRAKRSTGTASSEREQYPEDVGEKDIELHAAPATRAHLLDFLKAIEENSRPVADIAEGHISTASCILANLSMDLGRPLVYDPERREVPGDAEATKRLQRAYREGYVHPLSDPDLATAWQGK